jgi:DNA polymerase III subunit alpha
MTTASTPFVHLHCHSHYSLLDGANRIPELVARVKQLGMNAVALTDHGNLYGAIELYSECTAAGIKPIIGYEAYIAPGRRQDRDTKGMSEASYHLTLMAKNYTGVKNLVKMASHAYLDGFYYKPRIDKQLLTAHSEGLICLSGCLASEFMTHLIKDEVPQATKLAEWYRNLFRDDFYIEVQRNGIELQEQCNAKAIDIAQKMGVPLVATCDAHYLNSGDDLSHDVLLCINMGKLRSDANRMRYQANQFYVRSPQEMEKLWPELPDAVRQSQAIADKVDIKIDLKKRHFPVFTPPAGKTAEEYLRELCEAGLKERYGEKPSQAAKDRLEHELQVIFKLGFASYFLIVWDFVRYATEKGIPCGARGSACGAVVSYVLKLSHVDPLEYDLLFERFLDINRAESPDIDIDFCQDRREEVIQYVREKYGEQSVAQIATFGTMAARAAIKDVGRVMGIELDRVVHLTKMIPDKLGITLDESLEQSADLRQAYESDPQVHELLDIARKLEGTNRNVGTHAAGVVIANGPITDYVPVQRINPKSDTEAGQAVITTQWTMDDLDKVGLLKMDFLGLRTLTLLDKALRLIKERRGVVIDVQKLPLDDKPTYELLQSGKTQGVFQFESDGIRNLLRQMKPDNIRDIIASTALYRPGPMQGGMLDSYINCKHGREKPEYAHPIMEEVLSKTYGIMVFQESVMRILNRLGGIELSSAYACIKAISKKKMETIDQRRGEFIKGAIERGVSEEVAKDIFEKIVVFGGYGFNLSHSCAYALVSYQTAYLKTHYPAEFAAAVLTSEMGNTDKIVEHIKNAKEMGLEILPPDVNASDAEFSVASDTQVRFGLAAIKGFGRKAAEHIAKERGAKGPYKDLFELCERIDQRIVQRAAMETLVKAGALDCLGNGNRAALMLALPGALLAAQQIQEDRRRGQRHIFDMLDEEGAAKTAKEDRQLPNVSPWDKREQLVFEKEVLGFYMSSHPLAEQADVLRRFSSHTLQQLNSLPANMEVVVGGIIAGVRYTNAKRARNGDTRMARFKFEDMQGTVECVLFPDDFQRCKDLLKDDLVCFLKATVDKTREDAGLIVTRILMMDQVKREQTRGIMLRLFSQTHAENIIPRLGGILQKAKGRCPVYLEITDNKGRRARLRVHERYYVEPNTLPVDDLELLLGGAGHIEYMGAATAAALGTSGNGAY